MLFSKHLLRGLLLGLAVDLRRFLRLEMPMMPKLQGRFWLLL